MKIFRKSLFIFLFFLGFLCQSAFLNAETEPAVILSVPKKPLKTDVVLNVTPIRVKPLKAGKGVDALEKLPEELGPSAMIVVFRINRVLRGELAAIKTEHLSLLDQVKDAAGDKNVLKLITMDFHRPEEESAGRTAFSMVVANPYASFGIKEGAESSEQRYKISLARVHKNPDSYLLVKSEKS
jgi:hypothetical protein